MLFAAAIIGGVAMAFPTELRVIVPSVLLLLGCFAVLVINPRLLSDDGD